MWGHRFLSCARGAPCECAVCFRVLLAFVPGVLPWFASVCRRVGALVPSWRLETLLSNRSAGEVCVEDML